MRWKPTKMWKLSYGFSGPVIMRAVSYVANYKWYCSVDSRWKEGNGLAMKPDINVIVR